MSDDPSKVQAAVRAILAAGGTNEDVNDYLTSIGATATTPETTGEKVAGGVSAAYQGLTLGAGNKITAAIRTALPEFLGGESGWSGFPTALKEQTGILNDYRANHPVRSAALEMAGSLPTALAGGGAAMAANLSKVQRALRLAKIGGAYGAAQGGLSANRIEDVLPGVATGGLLGVVAAPVVGAAGGKVARGGARFAAKLPGRVGGLFGDMASSLGAVPTDVGAHAEDAIAGALRQGGVDPATAAASLVPGMPTTAMELGSRNVSRVARGAWNVPTSGAQQTLDAFLTDRSTGAGGRITSALSKGTGMKATDTELPIKLLLEKRAQEAAPLYDKAFAYGAIQDPETVAAIKAAKRDPIFGKAWDRGQRIARMEAGDAETPPAGIDSFDWERLKAQGLDKFLPKGMQPAATAPTVREVNAWKKGLDAQIESGMGSKNALSRSEARLYRQKLNGILDRVDTEVPDYATARANFKGNSEMTEAADAGAHHLDPSVELGVVKRQWNTMNPGEQEMYRWNAINAATAKIRKMAANTDLPESAKGTNIVQRLMGTSDAGDRMKMLFPDPDAYQTFLKTMEQEALYPKTARTLMGQSSTAAQQAETAALTSSTMRDIALVPFSHYAKAHLVETALRQLTGLGLPDPALASAIGKKAVLTGTPLEQMLQRMAVGPARRAAARAATTDALTKFGGIQAERVRGLLSQP